MIIYKITNKINGKSYIGQTVQKLSFRWARHKRDFDRMAISKAILKHGSDNFEIKILSTCSSLEEMNHREQYYIRLFNTLSPLGYNVKSGGHNSRMSEETKKKISNSLKGKPGHSVSQNTFSVNI